MFKLEKASWKLALHSAPPLVIHTVYKPCRGSEIIIDPVHRAIAQSCVPFIAGPGLRIPPVTRSSPRPAQHDHPASNVFAGAVLVGTVLVGAMPRRANRSSANRSRPP